MVVDGDDHVSVVERSVSAVAPHHQERGRLLAAYVTARSFARRQRRHQSLRESPLEPSKLLTIWSTTLLAASPFPSATQPRPMLLPAHPSQSSRSAPV